jgi:formylglycine-generating enzyme required for sulfatase activity
VASRGLSGHIGPHTLARMTNASGAGGEGTEPRTSRPAPADVSPIELAVLERMLADRAAGRDPEPAHYEALFPGHAELVRRLSAEHAAPTAVDGAPPRIGRYRVLRALGRGGQGRVYLAEDERLGRPVAVKVLSDLAGCSVHAMARFRLEAATASRLVHPGLCPVYDTGEHDGMPFLVMQYVAGEGLLAHCRRLPLATRVATTLALFEQVAAALHHAHEAGFVHRDVKPGNVLVTAEGQPIVIDFGLVRALDADGAALTRTGELFGTPAYLAPEQILAGSPLADRRLDVWALGVSLFEVLTDGRRPFAAPTYEALCRAITDDEPTALRLADAPGDLELVLATALAKEPTHRYATAADLASDLQRVRLGEPIRARPVTTWVRTRRWLRRNPMLAASLAAAVLLLVAGTAVSTWFAVRADRALADWARLADLRLVQQLASEQDEELWPATPTRLAQFDDWLVRANAITGRLPVHRQRLAALRATALPATDDDSGAARSPQIAARLVELAAEHTFAATQTQALAERRDRAAALVAALAADADLVARDQANLELEAATKLLAQASRIAAEAPQRTAEATRLRDELAQRVRWRFADAQSQFQHDQLAALLDGIEALLGDGAGSRADLQRRRDHAAALQHRVTSLDANAWRRCRADIARVDSPYAGLDLPTIAGLVPLGIDADSGLWEFWHVGSGERPQWNAVDGDRGRVELGATAREGMVLVLLPGGRFTMGSSHPDAGLANADPESLPPEQPPHEVTLAPFLLGKHEVNHAQWRTRGDRDTGFLVPEDKTPSGLSIDARHPVMQMTWQEAHEFCRRHDLDLPTEAQWEYACRAGSATPFATGAARESLLGHANISDASRVRAYPQLADQAEPALQSAVFDDGFAESAPIGSLAPNAFGVHDLLGNAAEWCRDRFYEYSERPPAAGDGLRGNPAAARLRTARPSNMSLPAVYCRSAMRLNPHPDGSWPFLGFRVARGIGPDWRTSR